MSLRLKLLIAAISGCLVEIIWISMLEVDSTTLEVAVYFVCGGLFAAGVFLPCLRQSDVRSWRPPALVVISGASFYLALRYALEWGEGKWGPSATDYVIASVIGAVVVLAAAPAILRGHYSLRFAVAVLVAALAGGAGFALLQDAPLGLFAAFALWHLLMAAALHVSTTDRKNELWVYSWTRTTRRNWLVAVSLIALLPLADDGLAGLIYLQHSARDGGDTVHEPFAVQGFRDRRTKPYFNTTCEFACLHTISDGSFAFQEYVLDDGNYAVFFLADRSDANCRVSGEDWGAPVDVRFLTSSTLHENQCMSYRVSDEPVARYAVRGSIKYVDALFGLYTLSRTERQVARISDHKIMSETVYYDIDSRIQGYEFGGTEPWDEFLRRVLPRNEEDWKPPE